MPLIRFPLNEKNMAVLNVWSLQLYLLPPCRVTQGGQGCGLWAPRPFRCLCTPLLIKLTAA